MPYDHAFELRRIAEDFDHYGRRAERDDAAPDRRDSDERDAILVATTDLADRAGRWAIDAARRGLIHHPCVAELLQWMDGVVDPKPSTYARHAGNFFAEVVAALGDDAPARRDGGALLKRAFHRMTNGDPAAAHFREHYRATYRAQADGCRLLANHIDEAVEAERRHNGEGAQANGEATSAVHEGPLTDTERDILESLDDVPRRQVDIAERAGYCRKTVGERLPQLVERGLAQRVAPRGGYIRGDAAASGSHY